MNTWPGAPFLGSLHPAGAQNKTLVLDTDSVTVCRTYLYNVL